MRAECSKRKRKKWESPRKFVVRPTGQRTYQQRLFHVEEKGRTTTVRDSRKITIAEHSGTAFHTFSDAFWNRTKFDSIPQKSTRG